MNHSIVQTLAEPHGHGVPIGRYLLHRQIARGGMATIHIARLMGDEGFSRIVAAKRLLPEFATDAEFVSMFLDEARIASKVHHRNVVPVLDVVATDEEVILVQEFVHGVPLHLLLRTARAAKDHIPVPVAVSIACQVLAGLQAAHETVDELGTPLSIVHRDVSPQNIMVAVDGTARLLDFGVAKATMAAHITRDGTFKGKLAYSSPEQLRGHANPQSDVYALSVVLWELLVGHRMHHSAVAESELVAQIMSGQLPALSEALAPDRDTIAPDRAEQLAQLEPIVTTGLAVSLQDRWASAADMEQALTHVVTPATPTEVAAWLKTLGRDMLDKNEKLLAAEEASWRRNATPVSRRTPMPGVRALTHDGRSPGSSLSSIRMPPRKRSSLVVALFGLAAIVGVAAGALYLWHGAPSTSVAAPVPTVETRQPPATETAATPTPPASEQAPAPPAAAAAAAPTPPPVETPAATPPPATQPTAAAQATTEKQVPSIDVEVQTSTRTTSSSSSSKAPSRPAQRAPSRQSSPPPPPRKAVTARSGSDGSDAPAAAPLPPAPPAAKESKSSKDDCTPPYYFEGSKKVFKPQCL